METMELKLDDVCQMLDAMLWVLGPYLDLPSMGIIPISWNWQKLTLPWYL